MWLSLPYTLWISIIAVFYDTPTTLVDLGYAKYQGTFNKLAGNVEFLGIRYAAAPTGSLRWREPRLPETTPSVQLANKTPSTCMQAGFGTSAFSPFPPAINHTAQSISPPSRSEDCLFLNVVTPALGRGDLPVVVWVHGGGYAMGTAWQYNATDLVREAGGQVVAVAIQYRLGLFGFLAGQEVRNNGTLNAGLLDQRFALQWVQRHISKFGGDPKKVTIWGESAGAGSVVQHLIADDGNTQPKLFRAGMIGSYYLPPQYAYNHWISEKLFLQVVEQTGCSSASDVLLCLRQIDADVLNQINTHIRAKGIHDFVPVVDGVFITDRPSVLLGKGKLNADAILAVANTHEAALPGLAPPDTLNNFTISEYIANMWPTLTKKQLDEVLALYEGQGKPVDQAIAIKGESQYICPTYPVLRALKGRAFKGQFAVPPAYHFDDVFYYFPNSPVRYLVSPPFNNTEFRNNFAQSFLNFAISLDPNIKWDSSNTLPYWPQWTERDHDEMIFNKTEADEPSFQVVPTDEGRLRRCAYWESISVDVWQ